MKELMIMYHPVKKEIRFLAKAKGEFVEIPYAMCPWLSQYGPDKGEFLLQNHGNKFFEDIWEQFLRDKVSLVFKGTKIGAVITRLSSLSNLAYMFFILFLITVYSII